jgi:hypothetical protein
MFLYQWQQEEVDFDTYEICIKTIVLQWKYLGHFF